MARSPFARALRSQMYRAARGLGTAQAAQQGPGSLAKRVVRRRVLRTTGRAIDKMFR